MGNQREFKEYLQKLSEPVMAFEANRIGRQVFELTVEQTRKVMAELWSTGYGLQSSYTVGDDCGSLERR